MSNDIPAIETIKLTKEYKSGVRALNELTIHVRQGEIFTLLGPNGTGKSTLISILTTYLNKSSGDVMVLGKDPSRHAQFVRLNIACVTQRNSADEHLSLYENMLFQSRLYKVDAAAAKKRIESLIESFDLARYRNYPTVSYSGGVKRRLDIAMNMIANPKILFLDEPTVGMDVQSRNALWKIIQKIRDEFGTTIFLTTHYLEEADELSDTICIMKDGHELLQDTPQKLRQYIRNKQIRIGFSDAGAAKACAKALRESQSGAYVSTKENSVYLEADDEKGTFGALNRRLIGDQVPFTALEIVQPSLEDVFLKLTGTEKEEAAWKH